MYGSVNELEEFYKSEIGNIVHGILARHISEYWPDVHGYRVLGLGYALPYLTQFDGAERILAAMPIQQGAVSWPRLQKNRVFMTDEGQLPIESVSIDRVLLVHYLEGCDSLARSLSEIWRVLKPNGRALVIVPNRMGFWARADWAPFGFGRPFTQSQLISSLCEQKFVHESHKGALFVPPLPDSPVMMRSANVIEHMGQSIFPFVAGVHIVEVSKQVYARADKGGGGAAVIAKTRELLGGKSVPAAQRCDSSHRLSKK